MAQHFVRYRSSSRRWRWIGITLLAVALIALTAEWLASRTVAGRLRALVDGRLDAKLELGTLVYIPPYGAWISHVELVRDGLTLASADNVRISLSESPLGDGPIRIASLAAHEPVLHIRRGGFDGIAPDDSPEEPDTPDKPPRKLSDVLRLKKLRFVDGRVTYEGRSGKSRAGGAGMEWSGLTLDIDTVQRSPSLYSFHIASRAFPVADASATGTIDVDDLMLDVQSLSVAGRTEPEPSRTAFPAPVQDFIRRHRISGGVALSGSAKVPLKDAQRLEFAMTVDLQDATAEMGAADDLFDRARASLEVRKAPAGPVIAQIKRIDIGTPGRSVMAEAGQLELDPTRSRWSLTGLRGKASFVRSIAPASFGNPSARAAATQPRGLDRFEPAGRADFVASASGPFKLDGARWWEAIEHQLIVYPRRVSFRPKDFAQPIEEIAGGEVRLSEGVIVFQELSGRYGDDRLRLRAARIPLETLPRLVQWREISGTVSFNPPVRSYSPKLDPIFNALRPSGTFLIAGTWMLDKEADRRSRHVYDLIISSDSGAFALTDRKIPIEQIRGDATVTPAGVELHTVEAKVLGGAMQLTGRTVRRPDEPLRYEGELRLQDVEVERLEERLAKEPPRNPLHGRLFVESVFQGSASRGAGLLGNLRALEARGEFEVVDGDLFKIPVLKEIAASIREFKSAATVGSAAAAFEVNKGIARFNDIAVSSPALGLQGDGTLGFDGAVDLAVVAAPLADWRDKLLATDVPVVSQVAGEVAGVVQRLLNSATGALLYQFRISGSITQLNIETVPTPVLTDAAAWVFEQMLEPQQVMRPRDLLRARQSPGTQTSDPK